jgi:hypothetical protein
LIILIILGEEYKSRSFSLCNFLHSPVTSSLFCIFLFTAKEELHNLYSSPSIIRIIKSRRMRWTVHVARMGEMRNAYRLLVGKPEGKRPLGRPRRKWMDNIKMDLGQVGCGDVDWIGLAQDRNRRRALVNSVMNLWVP